MIRYNKLMRELIKKATEYKYEDEMVKIDNICVLIDPKFKEIEGCIFIELPKKEVDEKKYIQYVKNGRKREKDFTEIEWEDSEVVIDHYIEYPDEIKGMAELKLGLKLQKIWANKLKEIYPNYKFCITLSYDCGEYPSATLRFHRVREDEIPYHLENDDLDSFKVNGMSVIHI